MPKPRVYVTRELPERGLRIIKKRFNAEVWLKEAPPPKKVIISKVRNVDALVPLLTDPIDCEVMDAAPKLKIISQMAVGFDNIDVKSATSRGIVVTNTPGVLTETTADFAWALIMAVARRVVEADRYVRRGKWKVGWHPMMMMGRDVYGATLGVVGLGRIGQAVARRARGFDMKILYYDTLPREQEERELGAKRVSFETLLRESDFVSLHVPLTKETTHLIGARQLRLMKKTAFLVNNSRGKVVNERALYTALKNRRIAGAGLDVFEQEPTAPGNPLFDLDNCVVAPHVAGKTSESFPRRVGFAFDNMRRVWEGKPPESVVAPE